MNVYIKISNLTNIKNFLFLRKFSKNLQNKQIINERSYDDHLPFYSNNQDFIRILLIRHAESIGNKDKKILKYTADHAVPLSETGIQQAIIVGEEIKKFYINISKNDETFKKKHKRLWVSPYRRARETADHILKIAGDWITDRREHILLGEQQFGLFEGHSDEELEKIYPREYAHFMKCMKAEGRFWARIPLGESRFDVAKRVHQAFGTFHRDAQLHGINDIIVVSHGVTLRAFLMMWLHKTPEWFEKESNPNNCSIRLIENNIDKGYIFSGFADSESQDV
jgi:2,3-bisphosphoglycerate-dependent phosphoglycerate mutase